MGKTEKHEKKSKKKHKHKTHKSKRKCERSKKGAKHSSSGADPRTKDEPKSIPVDNNSGEDASNGFEIPIELMNSKSHVPVTPEEHQRRQRHIRRVVDPSTGRTRLIRGDGEVLEEIVSKERHVEINKTATANDGHFFQEHTVRARVQERRK